MARESALAAEKAADAGLSRSAASRYYYAAYQAISAVLLYLRIMPPVDREAWSHESTPDLLIDHFAPVLKDKWRRRRMAERLRKLYKIRVDADYVSANEVGKHLQSVRQDAEFILRWAVYTIESGSAGGAEHAG